MNNFREMNNQTKRLIGLAIAGAGALTYAGIKKPWKRSVPVSEAQVKQESERATPESKVQDKSEEAPPVESPRHLMPEKELQQAASAMKEGISRKITDFKQIFDDEKKK